MICVVCVCCVCFYINIYIYTYIYICVCVCVFFVGVCVCGRKCFFSIVGKSFSVVRITFIFYSFMLLVTNSLIFQKMFSRKYTSFDSSVVFFYPSWLKQWWKIKHSKHRGWGNSYATLYIALLQYCDITTLFHCIQFVTNFVC